MRAVCTMWVLYDIINLLVFIRRLIPYMRFMLYTQFGIPNYAVLGAPFLVHEIRVEMI